MRRALLLGLLALALTETGCLRDPDPLELDENALTVHALLVTGSDSALVMITRERNIQSLDEATVTGVSGAEVRLIAGEDTTWLVETPGLPCRSDWRTYTEQRGGCYRATLAAPIASGRSYRLDIRLPEGSRITGETTTPSPVTLTAPAPGLSIIADCSHDQYCHGQDTAGPPYVLPVAVVPVAWEQPESVAGGSVALRAIAVYLDDVEYPGEACRLGHHSYYSPSSGYDDGRAEYKVANIGCNPEHPLLAPARFDSIRAELEVIGWDQTYRDYFTSGSRDGVRSEAASHGIEGAYGVFGAMSRATREIVLVRHPPPDPTP